MPGFVCTPPCGFEVMGGKVGGFGFFGNRYETWDYYARMIKAGNGFMGNLNPC